MIQLIGLLVIAAVSNTAPYLVCAIYLVAVGLAALGAAMFMTTWATSGPTWRDGRGHAVQGLLGDDSSTRDLRSFIGSASPSVRCCRSTSWPRGHPRAGLAARRPDRLPGTAVGLHLAPYGGKLADKIGGGKITLYVFVR